MLGSFTLPVTQDGLQGFVVYLHAITKSNTTVFVGVAKLGQLFNYAEARRNKTWCEVCIDIPGVEITTHILSYHNTLGEAAKAKFEAIRLYNPPANTMRDRAYRTMVYCVETGETWQSGSAAAQSIGCAVGTMNNHLNKHPNYKTVYGLHYERGVPPHMQGLKEIPT